MDLSIQLYNLEPGKSICNDHSLLFNVDLYLTHAQIHKNSAVETAEMPVFHHSLYIDLIRQKLAPASHSGYSKGMNDHDDIKGLKI